MFSGRMQIRHRSPVRSVASRIADSTPNARLRLHGGTSHRAHRAFDEVV